MRSSALRVQSGEHSITGEQAAGATSSDMAAQISALRAIVDDLDYGIVLLDQERRVRFVNRAFRRL